MKLYSLFEKKVFNIDLGLERIKNALSEISSPQDRYPSVLIGGTNGKGSTAVFLEALLRYHGLKTGLFLSPHLIEENERWQINRKNITDEELQQQINLIKPLIDRYKLTYFEASALIAFNYFYTKGIDVGIFEVGLGGRLDATNVVNPQVSIITNVSLDHTHILGETTYEIAREKLGIGRKNRPLIIGSDQIEIISQAVMKGIREIYHYPFGYTYKIKNNQMDYQFKDIKIEGIKPSLIGKRQFHNAATAITAFLVYCEKKQLNWSKEKIKKAVSSAYIPGRMQIIGKNPLVIVDGAHNTDAVIKTFNEIEQLFPEKRIITIYSGMKDKNWKDLLSIIKNRSDTVITTSLPFSRGLDEELKTEGVVFIKNLENALEKAVSIAGKDSVVLVTGSLYLVGEVLKLHDRINIKTGDNGRNTSG